MANCNLFTAYHFVAFPSDVCILILLCIIVVFHINIKWTRVKEANTEAIYGKKNLCKNSLNLNNI